MSSFIKLSGSVLTGSTNGAGYEIGLTELQALDGLTATSTELNHFDGFADAAIAQAADSIVFYDDTDSKLKRESVADFLAAIDGQGLSVDTSQLALDAAQTGLTSVLNASLVAGRDADNQIKFDTDDEIHFHVAGATGVKMKATGEIEATSLDISGDADIDGTMEADAYTVDGIALNEYIADTAGAMFSSNTESGLAVTYEDSDNTIDLALDAAQTIFTSVLNSGLTVGRDSDNVVDFATADNVIILKTDGSERMRADNAGVDVVGAITATTTATFEGVVSGAAGTFDALAGTSLALQNGGVSAAGAVAGVTTLDASGLASLDGGINVSDTLTVSAAGALAGATTVSGSGLFSMSAIDNDGVLNNAGAANIVGKLTVTAVSDLDGGIDVNASKFTVSTAGAVVAASTVSASAAVSAFSLNVDYGIDGGAGGITNAGAIAGATTIDASGDLTCGTITNAEFAVDASGNTDIDGTLNVEGVPTFQAQSVHSAGATFASQGLAACGAIAGATTIAASSTATIEGVVSGAAGTFDALAGTSLALQTGGITAAGAIAGASTVSGSGLFSAAGGLNAASGKMTVSNAGVLVAQSSSVTSLDASLNGQVAGTFHVGGATSLVGALTVGGNVGTNGSLECGTTLQAGGAATFQSTSQMNGTLTIGADDTGHDVQMFGAAAGSYLLWDEDKNGLAISKACAAGYAIDVANGAGDVRAQAFVTYSDRSLKTNIQKMDNALDKVMKLEAVTYDKIISGRSEIGFIAQDVAKIVPEVCALDANGVGRGIDYSRMSALLAGALKAQQEQIAQLKEIVAKLQKQFCFNFG